MFGWVQCYIVCMFLFSVFMVFILFCLRSFEFLYVLYFIQFGLTTYTYIFPSTFSVAVILPRFYFFFLFFWKPASNVLVCTISNVRLIINTQTALDWSCTLKEKKSMQFISLTCVFIICKILNIENNSSLAVSPPSVECNELTCSVSQCYTHTQQQWMPVSIRFDRHSYTLAGYLILESSRYWDGLTLSHKHKPADPHTYKWNKSVKL